MKTKRSQVMNNFRNELKNGFTTIPNVIVNDPDLSAKAKGVLLYLASKPDTWAFFMDDISKHFTDGLTAIKSAVKEIEKAGYLTRVKVKNEASGHFAGYDWILHLRKTRQSENPSVGKPDGRIKGGYSNTEDSNTYASNTDVSKTQENHKGAFAPKDDPGLLEKMIGQWNRTYDVQVRSTDKKRRQLRARLKTFTIPEIATAMANRARDPWLQREGIKHRGDWDSFFRNDEKIERYLNAKHFEQEDSGPLF
jgi:hypothetical protein